MQAEGEFDRRLAEYKAHISDEAGGAAGTGVAAGRLSLRVAGFHCSLAAGAVGLFGPLFQFT
jgi:hypothetical protein